jgi:hypothetical protein
MLLVILCAAFLISTWFLALAVGFILVGAAVHPKK